MRKGSSATAQLGEERRAWVLGLLGEDVELMEVSLELGP